MRLLLFISGLLFVILSVAPATPTVAQAGKPFDMPVAVPAGPSSWLFGQPYGNTTGAYRFGDSWYRAGQRLHFGIDLSMPCGTPLVAVAEGMVVGVDDLSFGAGPHNLLIRHEAYERVSLYGHLLERPALVNGQNVQRGQTVALSGDPDVTCDSRPHLHFEVRSLDYRTAYNPVDYINAAWHGISTIGAFGYPTFQRDLDNARRWLTVTDQPAVAFGGAALNNYAAALPSIETPPTNPAFFRDLGPLSPNSNWQRSRLGYEGCCFRPQWSQTDPNRLLTIDGQGGQRAQRYEWLLGEGTPQYNSIGEAPGLYPSPDGTHEVRRTSETVSVRRVADGAEWFVATNGFAPAISPDNSRIVWVARRGVQTPGEAIPPSEVWISAISGEDAVQITTAQRGTARWLDADRLLITERIDQTTTISVYDLRDSAWFTLGSWERVRGLTVAPGGGRLMFYVTFNGDSAADGIYTIETRPGAGANKMPWFGSWRWRDAHSVYFIPFNPVSNRMGLAYYHIPSGEQRQLIDPQTAPITIADGDWSVSIDGRKIVYLNADDMTMWLLEDTGLPSQ